MDIVNDIFQGSATDLLITQKVLSRDRAAAAHSFKGVEEKKQRMQIVDVNKMRRMFL